VETGSRDRGAEGACRYRIRIEGELGPGLGEWLDVDSIRSEGGVTVLDVTTVDQAQLHGLLRRLHDLHLKLIDLCRTELPCTRVDHDEP
jgi:hypothetical protein